MIDFLIHLSQPLYSFLSLLLSGTEEATLNLIHLSRQNPVFFPSELDNLLLVELRIFREAFLSVIVESHSARRRTGFLTATLGRAIGLLATHVHGMHLVVAMAEGALADVEVFADGQQSPHVTSGILDLLTTLIRDENLSGACSVDVHLLHASRLRLLHLLLETGVCLDQVFPHQTFDVVLSSVSLLLAHFSSLVIVDFLALAFLVHDPLPVQLFLFVVVDFFLRSFGFLEQVLSNLLKSGILVT